VAEGGEVTRHAARLAKPIHEANAAFGGVVRLVEIVFEVFKFRKGTKGIHHAGGTTMQFKAANRPFNKSPCIEAIVGCQRDLPFGQLHKP
jgi:hypothetical protein